MDCRWISDGEGEPIALVIPQEFRPAGYNFFTPAEMSFQLGVNAYRSGGVVEAHRHDRVVRTIDRTMEAILVRKGKMSLKLFDVHDRAFETLQLSAGDVVLLVAGGHEIIFLEDSEILEVKQGPFISREKDKTLLSEASRGECDR